jgi:hypothetical protein
MGHLGSPGITSGGAAFNQPLNLWNTSAATTLRRMFAIAPAFNQDISAWNIGSVTDLSGLFASVIGSSAPIYHAFNRPLGRWNTASVTDMSFLFLNGSYNQPLADWQTGSVTTMRGMFQNCPFNQPIGTWNVGSVTDMAYMFASVLTNTSRVAFNQTIMPECRSRHGGRRRLEPVPQFQQRRHPHHQQLGCRPGHQHARHVRLRHRRQRDPHPPVQPADRLLERLERGRHDQHVGRQQPCVQSGHLRLAAPHRRRHADQHHG